MKEYGTAIGRKLGIDPAKCVYETSSNAALPCGQRVGVGNDSGSYEMLRRALDLVN